MTPNQKIILETRAAELISLVLTNYDKDPKKLHHWVFEALSTVVTEAISWGEQMPETTETLREDAFNLAVELERRGQLEGHYCWTDMILKALQSAYQQGYDAAKQEK